MILNILGTLLFLGVCWLVGLAVLRLTGLTDGPWKSLHFISIPVGLAVCALTATFLYFRLDASVGAVRAVYGLLALTSAGVLWRKGTDRREWLGLLAIVLIFCVMAIPGLVRGDKYVSHRGNIYDQYFYISQVVYMGQHKLSYGTSGAVYEEAVPDVLRYGFDACMSDRPTAPLLCAVLTGKGWGNVFFQAYLYRMLLLAAVFGCIMTALEMISGGRGEFALRRRNKENSHGDGRAEAASPQRKNKRGPSDSQGASEAPGRRRVWAAVLGIAYIWGFFGQIQFDIDAWSQIASMSCLFALVCVYFPVLEAIGGKEKVLTPGRYGVLFLLGAGSFLIYPENTIIHGALLVLVSVLVCAVGGRKVPGKVLGLLAALPVLILAAACAADFRMVLFTLNQITTASSAQRQSWASYFDRYWLGFHPFIAGSPLAGAVKRLAAFIPSVFGCFLITPDYEIRIPPLTAVWLAAAGIAGLGMLALLCRSGAEAWRRVRKREEGYGSLFTLFALAGALVFAVMVFRQVYWSAGKLLLYVSPYLFLVLAFPIWGRLTGACKKEVGRKSGSRGVSGKFLSGKAGWPGRLVQAVSALFLVCQLLFAGMRVWDTAFNENSTGYLGNYPSDQMPYLKESYPYNFRERDYEGGTVLLETGEAWYQDYLKISLTYAGIPYTANPDSQFATGTMKTAASP